MSRRGEFQKKAMEYYGIKIADGEKRCTEMIMRECYLDFYSKSLHDENISEPYAKHLQTVQKEHNAMLEKILTGKAPPSCD